MGSMPPPNPDPIKPQCPAPRRDPDTSGGSPPPPVDDGPVHYKNGWGDGTGISNHPGADS